MLTPRQRVALDTLLPPDATQRIQPGLFEAGFENFYADFERQALPTMRLTFGLALFCAVWVAPLLIFRIPPLSLHSREVREQALTALSTSRIYLLRQQLFMLKTVVCFCYGADARVRREAGFPSDSTGITGEGA